MNIVWECDEVLEKDFDSCQYLLKVSNGREYIGYDGKYPDGTYMTSIRNKEQTRELYADLLKYDHEWIIQATGSEKEMLALEKELLDKVDAAKNPKYYNSSRSNGYKTDHAYQEVEQKYLHDEYEVTTEPWDVVFPMQVLQVRNTLYIPEHVNNMKGLINDTQGKWLEGKQKPVLVLTDYFGEGEHARIGKTNTITAISRTKFKPDLPVKWVPVEDWSQLSMNEIISLGQLDNPVNNDKTEDQDEESIIDNLVEMCNANNTDHTDPIIKRRLENMGYGITKIRGFKTKIKNQLQKPKALPPGATFIPWDKNRGQKYAEGLRSTEDSRYAISVSSGKVGKAWEQIVSAFSIPEAMNAKHWIIFVYHPSILKMQAWEKRRSEFVDDLENLTKWKEYIGKDGKTHRVQFHLQVNDQIRYQ